MYAQLTRCFSAVAELLVNISVGLTFLVYSRPIGDKSSAEGARIEALGADNIWGGVWRGGVTLFNLAVGSGKWALPLPQRPFPIFFLHFLGREMRRFGAFSCTV